MRPIFPLLAAALCLSGCDTASDTLDAVFPRPPMEAPRGIGTAMPPQDTPALEARAARERETLPKVPPAPDPDTYFNLSTVPPKPVMPSEAEIAAQVGGLQAEEQAGAAAIAVQADAEEPDTLPKPDARPAKGKVSTTPPAGPADPSQAPPATAPQAPYLSGAAPMEGEESSVFSRDNQAFLPQSQTIERTDLPPSGPQP